MRFGAVLCVTVFLRSNLVRVYKLVTIMVRGIRSTRLPATRRRPAGRRTRERRRAPKNIRRRRRRRSARSAPARPRPPPRCATPRTRTCGSRRPPGASRARRCARTRGRRVCRDRATRHERTRRKDGARREWRRRPFFLSSPTLLFSAASPATRAARAAARAVRSMSCPSVSSMKPPLGSVQYRSRPNTRDRYQRVLATCMLS